MRTLLALAVVLSAQKDPGSTKEAMRPVQVLVGKWTVTVTPEEGESWQEVQAWEYKIEKEEYGLQFVATDSKRSKEGLLSYDVGKKTYRLQLTGLDGKSSTYEGKLQGKELVLDQVVDDKSPQEKISYTFLRDNRFIGAIEKRAAGTKSWTETYKYQFTKQGVPFVKGELPKCVVTGGTGEIEVAFGGKTYLVCCNTCRKEFMASPEKTIANAKKEGWIK